MKSTLRVKICGITRTGDARAAVAAGADAIGLVFYPPSSRYVDVDTAATVARSVGPFVTVTGLFVDSEADHIRQVLNQVPLQLLQFHGDETPEFCQQFDRPFIKALRMKPELDVRSEMARYPQAVGFLLDAYHPAKPGGTGETFDWQRVPQQASVPIVLAGGLTPENVAAAVAATGVYAVDVSGGVEQQPGLKSAHKIEQFVTNARSV